MQPIDKKKRRVLLLPGDLLKLTITVKVPAYLNLEFEDVPVDERVNQFDICYGGVCD